MLKIVQAPNPVLSQIAKPITKFDASLQTLIKDMTKTLLGAHDPEGVGLAAPQVGKSLQLFIVKESRNAPLRVFINPKVTILSTPKPKKTKATKKKADKEDVKLEGCLSLKDIWGIVKRDQKVEVEYLDEQGKKHLEVFTDFLATIMQHEYDHLQGTLFPKRVLEQKGTLYKSVINKKNEMEFEEVSL